MAVMLTDVALPNTPRDAEKPARAYRGVAPEQRRAERQQRLLAAGLELFARQGYARTTIEQLCSEAKVTARHFYAIYPSREALLTDLYDRILQDLREAALVAIHAPEQSFEEKIPRAMQALITHYLADSRLARVGVLESVGVSAAMEKRRRAAIHDMAGVIEGFVNAMVSRGELPAHNYHLVCVALVGGINELLAEWLTVAEPPSIAQLSHEIIRIFYALIRGSAVMPPTLFTQETPS